MDGTEVAVQTMAFSIGEPLPLVVGTGIIQGLTMNWPGFVFIAPQIGILVFLCYFCFFLSINFKLKAFTLFGLLHFPTELRNKFCTQIIKFVVYFVLLFYIFYIFCY